MQSKGKTRTASRSLAIHRITEKELASTAGSHFPQPIILTSQEFTNFTADLNDLINDPFAAAELLSALQATRKQSTRT